MHALYLNCVAGCAAADGGGVESKGFDSAKAGVVVLLAGHAHPSWPSLGGGKPLWGGGWGA